MERNLEYLTEKAFDVLIVGGGIIGACAAWDAILRGLSVVLIDKGDFGAATSANSLKIIHGGLRYLQKGNLLRIRESICERSALMRIAPHLIYPMPFIIPTYAEGRQKREILHLAIRVNNLLGNCLNRSNLYQANIPRGQIVSRTECLRIFPGFVKKGLTGGAIWYDCQVYNSERLTLSFLLSACKRGAVVANYVEASELLTNGNAVYGVRARDALTGDVLDVRGRVIVNAAGPWVYEILRRLEDREQPLVRKQPMALGINLVTHRHLGTSGVCVKMKTAKSKDQIGGSSRFLFLVPWREYTLIGTSYRLFQGHPDKWNIQEEDLQHLIDECNRAIPDLGLSLDDVFFYHAGLLPLKNTKHVHRTHQLATRHLIMDHASQNGVAGLVSAIGVKYTTARALAEKAIDLVFKKLGVNNPPRSMSAYVPIYGGDLDASCAGLNGQSSPIPNDFPAVAATRLEKVYGSSASAVTAHERKDSRWADPLTQNSPVLRCEVLTAIRNEMAVKLADVVFRRTDMGSAGCPPRADLELVAQIMAEELGWDPRRQTKEIDEVLTKMQPLGNTK